LLAAGLTLASAATASAVAAAASAAVLAGIAKTTELAVTKRMTKELKSFISGVVIGLCESAE
jgi:hypothetical protein